MVLSSTAPLQPQLPRFYAGREVLVTGATGFMGKVLLERLLYTCPEGGRVHLLVRGKGGEAPRARLARLKDSPVFDNIREACPQRLDRLVALPGDTTKPRLGLDDTAVAELSEVSAVFHVAANVKFYAPLSDAVSHNVLSALHVMDVCDELPALEALVHVSTAFCNEERRHVAERVYEARLQPAQVLALLQALPPDLLTELTPKLIYPKSNTYVFTKALAEVAVAQRARRHYSVAIFRPSIVISSHRAPFPGWVEGLSGATGAVVSTAQGVLRVFRIAAAARADVVPVDVAADCMLAAAWDVATDRPPAARVYYCGSQDNPLLWKEFRAEMLRVGDRFPFEGVLYHPFPFGIANRYAFKVFEVCLQTVPLYIADYISKLLGIKRRFSLITVAQQLSSMSHALGSFTCKEWIFSSDNMRRLKEKLHNTDGHLFYLDIKAVNWVEHIDEYHRGARKFLLHQSDSSLPQARKHMRRLHYIHYAVQLFLALMCYKLLMFLTSLVHSYSLA